MSLRHGILRARNQDLPVQRAMTSDQNRIHVPAYSLCIALGRLL